MQRKYKNRCQTIKYRVKYDKCIDCSRKYLEVNMITIGGYTNPIHYCIRCYNARFYKRSDNKVASWKISSKDGRTAKIASKIRQDKNQKIRYKFSVDKVVVT